MSRFNEDLCIQQTYEVLVGSETLHTLMGKEVEVHLLFNPQTPIKNIDPEVFDILIEYYVETEEYEKCQKIMDLKKVIC
jgi:hypothetical protein|tara:strand:+ start:983 stop:1219 length:237 start_codon:yes stop_codon:yes gene_type:complete